MKHRLLCLRRHRPAIGQLWFLWVTVWTPLEPPRPTPLPHGWWRRVQEARPEAARAIRGQGRPNPSTAGSCVTPPASCVVAGRLRAVAGFKAG